MLSATKTGTGAGDVSVDTEESLNWIGNIGAARYSEDRQVTLTAVPKPGSVFAGWSPDNVCNEPDLTGPFCTVTIGANTSVTATFDIKQYTVTPNAGANGSLDPATPQTVLHNNVVSFTVTPDAGYLIDDVSGCGGTLSGNTYAIAPVIADCTVTATFRQPAVVTLLAPNGGEVFTEGESTAVSWSAADNAESYLLSYSLDNGATWTHIKRVTGSTSSTWNVPDVTVSQSACRFRVIARDAQDVTLNLDSSDSVFTILNLVPVTLLAPNGGEVFTEDESTTVSWSAADNAASYLLHYSFDNGASWTFIKRVTGSTSANWLLPNVTENQTACRFRVIARDAQDVTLNSDTSDSVFTILNLVPVTLFAPNGGEVFTEGQSIPVSWSAADNATSYLLHYSFDNGATWTFIERVTGSAFSTWNVPDVTVSQTACLFRVVARDAQDVTLNSDTSDSVFTILAN